MSKSSLRQPLQDPEIKKNPVVKEWSDLEKKLMNRCLRRAESAQKKGEIPVAALIIDENGTILAESGNQREQKQTVLGHSELVVLHNACKKQASWRLANCTLIVTLEPCHMCAAAIMQARIKKVIFATRDPKAGAFGSKIDLSSMPEMHHKIEICQGLFAEESSQLIKKFFKKRRFEKKTQKTLANKT